MNRVFLYKCLFLLASMASCSLLMTMEQPTEQSFPSSSYMQPHSLMHFVSKQISKHCALFFHEINGNTIDALPEPINKVLYCVEDVKNLIARHLLIAAAQEYVFDFQATPVDTTHAKPSKNKMLAKIKKLNPHELFCYSQSPNKRFVVSTYKNGTIKLFEYKDKVLIPIAVINEQITDTTQKHNNAPYVQFLDATTFFTYPEKSHKIIIWHINEENNQIEKIKEEKINKGVLYVNILGDSFYLKDETNTIWTVAKDKNNVFLHRVMRVNPGEAIIVEDTKENELILLTDSSLTSDFHFIMRHNDATHSLYKKFALDFSKNKDIETIIKDHYLSKKMIESFHNGILTCRLYCKMNGCEGNHNDHIKHMIIDNESETVLSISDVKETVNPCYNAHFDIPPLEAIFAFIAYSNSKHDEQQLHALTQSQLVQNLSEPYKSHIIEKINGSILSQHKKDIAKRPKRKNKKNNRCIVQ